MALKAHDCKRSSSSRPRNKYSWRSLCVLRSLCSLHMHTEKSQKPFFSFILVFSRVLYFLFFCWFLSAVFKKTGEHKLYAAAVPSGNGKMLFFRFFMLLFLSPSCVVHELLSKFWIITRVGSKMVARFLRLKFTTTAGLCRLSLLGLPLNDSQLIEKRNTILLY